MKYTITLIIIVVVVAVGVLVYASLRSDKNQDQTSDQTSTGIVDSPKKGIKRFTLEAKVEGVSGDGSITLKEELTSMAVRLINAPAPGEGEDYEVYVVPQSGEPILAGPMIPVNTPNEKYLWAGAGAVDWFTAKSVLVTKRSKSGAKPGATIAESAVPSESQQAQ